MREQDEIEEKRDEVASAVNKGQNKYPGMTYAEGVRAALEWVLEDNEDDLDV